MSDAPQHRTFSANPYDCLHQIAPALCVEHQALVSESKWIGAGSALIRNSGAEDFLLYLLANLKGMNASEIANESDIQSMITNPFYCLTQIASALSEEHEPGMSEAQWIRAGIRMIQQKGPEEFLSRLLANLRTPDAPPATEDAKTQPDRELLTKKEIADAIVDTTRLYTEAYFETSGKREMDKQLWAALHVGFTSALKTCGYDSATVDEALALAQEDEFFDE